MPLRDLPTFLAPPAPLAAVRTAPRLHPRSSRDRSGSTVSVLGFINAAINEVPRQDLLIGKTDFFFHLLRIPDQAMSWIFGPHPRYHLKFPQIISCAFLIALSRSRIMDPTHITWPSTLAPWGHGMDGYFLSLSFASSQFPSLSLPVCLTTIPSEV